MKIGDTRVLVCNCEKTMELDGAAIAGALDAEAGPVCSHLCRTEIDRFEAALEEDGPLLVACTQEAPLFSEVAGEAGKDGKVAFINIRENAGWSASKAPTAPKIAALLRAAMHDTGSVRLKSIESDGLCLVYGSGQQAFETARLLSGRLSVTLLLADAGDLVLPPVLDFAVYSGRVSQVSGGLGGFEVVVDGYAPIVPSSRAEPAFVLGRDGARSECSLILDISGGDPLVPGHRHRDGYMRADPGDPSAVLRAAFELSDMVGEFEKPLYVDYRADICAHSRSQITGCTNCLDACPASAIQPDGDGVAIDPLICGGCGFCSASCPSGAVEYSFPGRGGLLEKVQILLGTYDAAGGRDPVLLIHDETAGTALLGAMARFGRGLPANVLPLAVHSSTMAGHVEMTGMIAAGAARVIVLADPARLEEHAPCEREASLAHAILDGLGVQSPERITVASENDPDNLETLLWELEAAEPAATGRFAAIGGKRETARTVFNLLAEATGAGETAIALPDSAPYGQIEVDTGACTLCLACVSACPANALQDNPDKPQVRFVEAACLQCGICASTCPENAITLEPRLNLAPSVMEPRILYEEEPFACTRCGKPFASKSTIDRIVEALAGKHSMFADEERAKLITMCEDCRIEVQAASTDQPFAVGERPKTRTTEDYLSKNGNGKTADDFLIDD